MNENLRQYQAWFVYLLECEDGSFYTGITNDLEKRILINSIGSVWEGNQVWFILGGGAIFAAWPYVYAVSFSGFYFNSFTYNVNQIVGSLSMIDYEREPFPMHSITPVYFPGLF